MGEAIFSNTISGLVLPLVGIDLWYVVLTGTGPNPGGPCELVKGFHRAVVRAEALCFGEPTGWEPASGRLSADAADELTNSHRLKVASFRFVVTTLQLLVIGVIISPLWSGKHLWGPGLLLAMGIYALLKCSLPHFLSVHDGEGIVCAESVLMNTAISVLLLAMVVQPLGLDRVTKGHPCAGRMICAGVRRQVPSLQCSSWRAAVRWPKPGRGVRQGHHLLETPPMFWLVATAEWVRTITVGEAAAFLIGKLPVSSRMFRWV